VFSESLTLEDVTGMLYRNVGNQLPIYTAHNLKKKLRPQRHGDGNFKSHMKFVLFTDKCACSMSIFESVLHTWDLKFRKKKCFNVLKPSGNFT
jgi:hypothetical protein